MLKQNIEAELNVKLTGSYNTNNPTTDAVIDTLLNTNLWKLQRTNRMMGTDRYLRIHCHMKRCLGGRYTIRVRKLKRKYKGHTHHVIIYWTPYHARDCKWIGYVKSGEELLEAVRQVNPDLLNPERNFASTNSQLTNSLIH